MSEQTPTIFSHLMSLLGRIMQARMRLRSVLCPVGPEPVPNNTLGKTWNTVLWCGGHVQSVEGGAAVCVWKDRT